MAQHESNSFVLAHLVWMSKLLGGASFMTPFNFKAAAHRLALVAAVAPVLLAAPVGARQHSPPRLPSSR